MFALIVAGGTLSLAAPADAQTVAPRYTIDAIETLGGDRNFANDISDAGFVTGNSRRTDGGRLLPYVWRAGSVEEIPLLPNSPMPTTGRGFSVNDQGVVVGESGNGPSQAFRYDSTTDTLTNLGSLPGGSGGVANGINNAGRVIGAASNGQSARAFYTDAPSGAGLNDLGTPLGTSDSFARAYGINDAGVVVGVARNAADSASEPTLWRPTDDGGYGAVTIGSPAGEPAFGEAFAVNNLGQAVGRFSDPVSGDTRAFFYDGDTSVELSLLDDRPDFDNARALDINDAGLAVGYVANFDNAPSFGGAAVAWDGGDVIDLNTRLAEDSGWTLLSAQGLNAQGQIVGYGTFEGDTRAFVMNPIPEPGAAALFSLGALALIARRRRSA